MEVSYFTILWWFLPYIHMNQPWVYMCSPSDSPSHFPPHPICQGHLSALSLSILFHASNFDWSSISHMALYMFQCYSLKSYHPCLLPQSPKVCSLHLCLFCCLPYRVVITVRLHCPWGFPVKNIGVCCHFSFQGTFPTQGLNMCLLHWLAL